VVAEIILSPLEEPVTRSGLEALSRTTSGHALDKGMLRACMTLDRLEETLAAEEKSAI
jgi:hypothetical protein